MSMACAASAAVLEIVPVSFHVEHATRRLPETTRGAVVNGDLPAGVQPIGEVLPLVLAELGLAAR